MTLVSHDHAFVFLKTRKTAGTTIEHILKPACLPPGRGIADTEFLVSRHGAVGAITGPKARLRKETPWWRPIWYHHMPAAEVRRLIGRRRFARYRKLSSVRNPFDRVVSHFHFRLSRTNETLGEFARIRARFRDFVLSSDWEDDWDIVSVNGSYIVDDIIRFEHLREDLEAISTGLGLAFDATRLPHEKNMSTTRKSYAVPDYYDSETIEVVRQRLGWMFERFGYPTEPSEEMRQ